MIQITYSAGEKIRLTIKGHAETQSPEHPNIICAAVSTLFCTLANSLEYYGVPAEIKAEPGDSEIVCSNTHMARILFDMEMIGIEGIANANPENVMLTAAGWGDKDTRERPQKGALYAQNVFQFAPF